jgi:hypothetical protein
MRGTFPATIAMAAIALACLVLAANGQAGAPDQMKLPKETLAADSESSFNQGSHYLHSGSSQSEMQEASEALEKLGAGGHLAVLDAGTQVKAMGGGTRVRVIGGPHAGQVWWLFTDEDVRKPGDVPPGAVEER